MNILYVTTALLSYPHTGCMLRTFNIARQLSKVGRVTMLGVSHRFDPGAVSLCRKEFAALHLIELPSYAGMPKPWGELRRKWDMHWPFAAGLKADAAGQALYSRLLGENDLVWFHTLGAALPFNAPPPAASVMDLDDLNHCKYDLRAQQDAALRFRCSARVQSLKWKRHEFKSLNQYGTVVVCSDEDKRYLAADNVRTVPNGFTSPPAKPVRPAADPDRLGFIGTLGYGPNYKGLLWFRENVWPRILRQNPRMRLRLVGSPPPEQYRVEAEGFESLGYVENPDREIETWSAMIVPILYGGGTRIKIVEAFSKLCPVVATPTGAHGIHAAAGADLLLAADPETFADCCLDLSAHPEKGRALAESAWRLFTERYTWDRIGQAVIAIARETAANKGGAR